MTQFPLGQLQINYGVENGFAEIVEEFYQELFDYYFSTGEMPYGTAKARDGDPFQWLTDKLEEKFVG